MLTEVQERASGLDDFGAICLSIKYYLDREMDSARDLLIEQLNDNEPDGHLTPAQRNQ